MQINRIFITCPKGIQPYLATEVQSLGFPVITESVSGVETEGTLQDTMRLNLYLRTGHRVLYLLSSFSAENPDELYRESVKVPWEDYIYEDGYVSITSTVDTPSITDSRFANLKCKDAIADRFITKFGRRPDSGPERNRAVIHLHWKDESCALYIDTSGEPLSKRGYRKIPLKAPLQETLASAIVKATGWDDSGNFINPMCGSGTLAIEAALIGLKKAPGMLRSNFCFMHLRSFDKTKWEHLRFEASRGSQKSLKYRIIATDSSKQATEAARKNAMTAGVEHLIEFRTCDFADTPVPGGSGIVLLNPEYGERMGQMDKLAETYSRIGDFFKQKCKGYSGYIFTGNPHLSKKIGLRSKRKIQFFNSNIECRLLEYELYEGTKKPGKSRTDC
ncbi:MAG: class I SAM-dependent RNA methyltransferase [Nitrospirota bacterium]|nr:class I SAM-dependent RNA methyltransferase [Nitrospirota bacterium]